MAALPSNTSSMKKALCFTNVFEKLQIWQFNQTYNTFPMSRKKILKLFSLGPRYHRQKWKCKKPFFLFRRKLQCQLKWSMWGLLCGSYISAMKVFPCKEKSCCVVTTVRSAEGKWDIRSTWITVRTLDVSKSEANSL